MNNERMHPVLDDAAWSESYYFNFVDPDTKIGMFTRMGFRPGNGWADALHVIYLEGRRVAFTYGRRDIQADLSRYDGDLAAGSLQLECLEPHQLWQWLEEACIDGEACEDDEHLLNGLNTHAGHLTYAAVGAALGIDVLSPRLALKK